MNLFVVLVFVTLAGVAMYTLWRENIIDEQNLIWRPFSFGPLGFMIVFLWTSLVWFVLSMHNFCKRRSLTGSGRGKMQTMKLVDLGDFAGCKSIQGRRPHMEDTYQAILNLDTNEWHQKRDTERNNSDSNETGYGITSQSTRKEGRLSFFGVFDGHGGKRTSNFAAKHLHVLLQHDLDLLFKSPSLALTRAFEQLDENWLSQADCNGWDDGSTAVVAVIFDNMIHVANVGDSRAVLCDNGRAIDLSQDHKPNRQDEKERVEKLNGRIIYHGTWRVEGVLAVTRAFGDRRLKRWVCATPEIKCFGLGSQTSSITPNNNGDVNYFDKQIPRTSGQGNQYLILATDGIWDVLTSRDAAEIVNTASTPQLAAEKLTDTAYQLGSCDNITSLVIDLSKFTY